VINHRVEIASLKNLSVYLSSFFLGTLGSYDAKPPHSPDTYATAILVYYSRDIEKIKDSYWAQNFTVYSVLVAAAIGMAKQNLSKMHTIVAMEFVGSPLTFYMAFYAIRSFLGNQHRLSKLFDGPRWWYRIVALCTFAIWAVMMGK
jgi:hypothetical protein